MGLMTIKSEAFEHNRPIPARYTQDGVNVSPPLAWVGLPEGAKELVLIVDDPDAPRKEAYVHWVIYGIPATVKGLPEGVPGKGQLQDPPGVKQGKNSAGEVGYVGPAPPKGHGRHRYYFQLYALDQPLGLEPEAEKSQVMAAMKGRVLAKAQVIGTYERK